VYHTYNIFSNKSDKTTLKWLIFYSVVTKKITTTISDGRGVTL